MKHTHTNLSTYHSLLWVRPACGLGPFKFCALWCNFGWLPSKPSLPLPSFFPPSFLSSIPPSMSQWKSLQIHSITSRSRHPTVSGTVGGVPRQNRPSYLHRDIGISKEVSVWSYRLWEKSLVLLGEGIWVMTVWCCWDSGYALWALIVFVAVNCAPSPAISIFTLIHMCCSCCMYCMCCL